MAWTRTWPLGLPALSASSAARPVHPFSATLSTSKEAAHGEGKAVALLAPFAADHLLSLDGDVVARDHGSIDSHEVICSMVLSIGSSARRMWSTAVPSRIIFSVKRKTLKPRMTAKLSR